MRQFFSDYFYLASAMLVVAVVGLLTGCAMLRSQPDLARTGITLATAKFIENSSNPVARAQNIKRIAETTLALAGENPESTVLLLQQAVMSQLPATLSPVDRAIAGELIRAVAAELAARVGGGVIAPDKLVSVKQVLQAVIEGTRYFIPPNVESP